MKRHGTFLAFLAIWLLNNSVSLHACPISLTGKIKVIDAYGKDIPSAEVYYFYTLKDSSQLSRGSWLMKSEGREEKKSDTGTFYLWSSGWWSDGPGNARDKELLIRANGYADVIVREIDFLRRTNYNGFDDGAASVLVVTLYPPKLVRESSTYQTHSYFEVRQKLVVQDTFNLNWAHYQREIVQQTTAEHGQLETVMVNVFPNPARENLTIAFRFAPNSTHRILLSDALGKTLLERETNAGTTELIMGWYPAGNYCLTVYDPKGNPIHRQWVQKL